MVDAQMAQRLAANFRKMRDKIRDLHWRQEIFARCKTGIAHWCQQNFASCKKSISRWWQQILARRKTKISHKRRKTSRIEKSLYWLIIISLVILLVTLFVFGIQLFDMWWLSLDEKKPEYYFDAITIVGSACGGIILVINAIFLHRRAKAMDKSAEAHVTENQQNLFNTAIKHLGDTESKSVRLGGIYTLYELAKEEQYRERIHAILCSHARSKTDEAKYKEQYKDKPSVEIQSLINLLVKPESNMFQVLSVNFERVRLQGAELQGAQLQGANLAGAQLQGADLRGAQLQGASLREAQLQEAHLEEAQLRGAILVGAQLEGAYLWKAQLQEAKLAKAKLQRAGFVEAKLQGANLEKAQLQEANLEKAQLQEAILEGAKLQKTKLIGTRLQRARLAEAKLQGAILRKARLQGADLRGAQLQGAILWEAQLQRANLVEAQLQETELRGTQLQGANLREAQLQGTNLEEAQLQGAYLEKTQLQEAHLKSAKLQGAFSSRPRPFGFQEIIKSRINQDTEVNHAVLKGINDSDFAEIKKNLNLKADYWKPDKRSELQVLLSHLEKHLIEQDIPDQEKIQYLKDRRRGAETGSYDQEYADKIIAEYEEAMQYEKN